MPNKHQAMISFPMLSKCMGVFILFSIQLLTTCVQTIITHHQRSLVPSMFVSHYQLCVSIALQRAQAITILKRVATLGRSSSFLPHIIANAPLSLVDLWQATTFLSQVFFVIIDCHFIAMGTIFIGFFFIKIVDCLFSFYLWVMSTCAFICLVLLIDGFPSLIFIYMVFFHS